MMDNESIIHNNRDIVISLLYLILVKYSNIEFLNKNFENFL
jgi:hypothetical protein